MEHRERVPRLRQPRARYRGVRIETTIEPGHARRVGRPSCQEQRVCWCGCGAIPSTRQYKAHYMKMYRRYQVLKVLRQI